MKTLISSSDLNVNDETEAYEAVMMWIQHDVDNRKTHLAEIMSKVRLPLLNPSYLQRHVATNSLVRNCIECRDYLDEAKFYHMSLANLVQKIPLSQRTRARKSYAGVLFCVGGRGSSGDPFKSVECYDPRKDCWFLVSEMTTRRRHVGVCCTGGLLYAIGGHDGNKHMKSGEVYDPVSNKWKVISLMSTPRRGLSVACLGGAIYSVGGLDDSTCYNTVERYDPGSDTWTFVASMNTPRGGVGVVSLKVKTILFTFNYLFYLT
ncbi:hypothetical protein KUTeg_024048 [Tegillarca granosa]|uniref:BACK domain-containing protein n=1 Tax=Tegillarca granosa TaxID=220873 RepID=A0ABQ9DWW7_TEGGR|nr:hypothetical protein KUTeg_024048 [Tegillarca granosa]